MVKLSDYIESRKIDAIEKLKNGRREWYTPEEDKIIKEMTKIVRLYVPDDMRTIFGFGEWIDIVFDFLDYLPSYLEQDVLFTEEMANFLELDKNVKDDVVGLYIKDICVDMYNTQHFIEFNLESGGGELYKQLKSAIIEYEKNRTETNYDLLDEKSEMWGKYKKIIVEAILNKLSVPEFDTDTDSEDDYGLIKKRDYDLMEEIMWDEQYVVCERSGNYSDYESEPIAIFNDKTRAKKFIKSIHKKIWSTKIADTKQFKTEIRKLNPLLLQNCDTCYGFHYTIESVPKMEK